MKLNIRPTRLLVATAVLAASLPLQANTADQALAAACKGCHGHNAVAPLTNLTNLTQDRLFDRLRDYRSGTLNGTIMNRIALGYSVDELQRIAAELTRTADDASGGSL